MIVKKLFLRYVLFATVLFSTMCLNAQDRVFTYTYQSGVLNKGQREIELWNTYSTGKTEFFNRLENRTEFEIGLGHRLQTSIYLNLTTETNGVDNPSGGKSLETENQISISNEWKYKLLDAVADPVGVALYGEVGIGTQEKELEAKLIVDKKFDKFTLATNAVFELEKEVGVVSDVIEWATEHKAELNIGLAYSLSPKFQITTEHAFRNVFIDGQLKHSALYSGVGLSYAMDNFWINLTAMPQVKGFKGTAGNSLNLSEYEKMQYRVLVSFAF